MLTERKPLMRVLRRSHTSSSSSPSSSSNPSSSPSSSSWTHLRSVLLVVASSSSSSSSSSCSPVNTNRGTLKSPWSRRRRKHALLAKQWKSLFTPDGRLIEGGIKFLKKVRSGGVDPSIRAEVWPFLLGVYELSSSKEERGSLCTKNRKEYESLRKECHKIHLHSLKSSKLKENAGNNSDEGSGDFSQVLDSPGFEDVASSRRSVSSEGRSPAAEDLYAPLYDETPQSSGLLIEGEGDKSALTCEDASVGDTKSTDSDSSEETENVPLLSTEESGTNEVLNENVKENSKEIGSKSKSHTYEDFVTWQRIIQLDAVRANDEWIVCSPSQAAVSEIKAQRLAQAVGLKDYDHLEPFRIYHAARLVAILEAYALYDPEIGYCQGMSDLLSPIASILEEDHEAFWCFVGFMKKARHNFRLDEVGIRRQLSIVSKIIKSKDIHLYRHLEKLEAQDCFFVYRMVVVLFRRELTFEQTLCLWEVMWADQAAIRAGIAKSAWGSMRLRAPPTDDLLLYAIAACVLQRRKLIIEKYSSMDEIMRECNSMAGHLDVWKLLDDAHDLVVTLHDKIEETL
ncbi:rab GTPase-activating protein 22-like isoform X2 [Mangifera indica]|uniref:rab GTPase-activating protein 22-like isoform X2 n=1 Tax=Mangifera indica TaxID=29780 RepID=UPI001CFB2F0B|nr:rab GTPase-activating protein 22-like isoform X2 [Mangifera indica]XP_044484983.1 rab GTPase-activating protein 22-like isoform X2 [Mangifera indica]XP_044484985.1 rab GTPase-activating protein 22-like isoform X2 [Mangifera indica]